MKYRDSDILLKSIKFILSVCFASITLVIVLKHYFCDVSIHVLTHAIDVHPWSWFDGISRNGPRQFRLQTPILVYLAEPEVRHKT